jgi:hypothetical protein
LRSDRSGNRDVVKDFAAHAVGNFGRAFDKAPDLEIDAATKLLDAKTAFNAVFDDAFEQRTHRPPERALGGMRLNVLDTLMARIARAACCLHAARRGAHAGRACVA